MVCFVHATDAYGRQVRSACGKPYHNAFGMHVGWTTDPKGVTCPECLEVFA